MMEPEREIRARLGERRNSPNLAGPDMDCIGGWGAPKEGTVNVTQAVASAFDNGDACARFLHALIAGHRQQCRSLCVAWLTDGTDVRVICQDRAGAPCTKKGDGCEQADQIGGVRRPASPRDYEARMNAGVAHAR